MKLNFSNEPAVGKEVVHVYASIDTLTEFELLKESLNNKKLQLFLKRSFDIAVSLFLILLFLPILIMVSLLIKLGSGGLFYIAMIALALAEGTLNAINSALW